MGFAWSTNLSKFYNGDLDKLDKFLRTKGEKPSTVAQIKRFMSLRPGDIIALKGVGSPIGKTARLDIVGYAIVVEREGIVYRHDPDSFPNGLGHLINADFFEFGIKRTMQLGYGRTIHKIEDQNHIDKIFGSYADVLTGKRRNIDGSKKKNTDETTVNLSSSYIRKAIHNKIQQGLYDNLVKELGESNVKMEENYIDLIVTRDNSTEFIEVKPYHSATHCIREGLGQLLSYYQKYYSDKPNVSLTIIGSKEANADDKEFIKFIQTTLKIKFKYDSWERLGSR